ncbi:MAG: DUF4382 domain-containing protein [Cyanobacteria bacterium P01_E01_bin.42]
MLDQKFLRPLSGLALLIPLTLLGCTGSQSSSPNSETSEETVGNDTEDRKGTLKLVANGEDFVRQGFVSKDGWEISFDRVWVNLAEVTAYQVDSPEDIGSDKAADATQVVLVEEAQIIDLAEGDADADPIVVAEVDAVAGQYNALAWQVVNAADGEYQGQAIVLQGTAKKADSELDFTLAFNKELNYACGEFVGDERKGIVKDSETAEVETTFHFDHIFGDIEAPDDDHINTGAIGFDPIAALAEDDRVTVDLDTLKDNLDEETYTTLEAAIASLGHVGEGHCE